MTVYARPGTEGSLMSFAARYDNYIGGEWVPPAQGRYFENPSARHRADLLRGAPVRRDRHRARAGRCTCRRTGVGQDLARRAGGDPQQDRRPHRGEPRVDRRRRVLGQRQAGPGDTQRRYPAGSRPFPVLRRRDPRPGRVAVPDRRRHRRLPLPRTARGGRPDHPVELPDPDGRLEAGPRTGGRQRRRTQAGRADPGLDPLPVLVDRRPASAGVRQHRQRVWRGGRQAAGIEQPDRQDRVHRRDHHRPADHAVRSAEPHPGDARTGRQEPEHLLLRRDGRGRRLSGQGAGGLHDVRPQPG